MPLIFVGESLNATIPKVCQAVKDHDDEFVKTLSARQAECGAHMLDVNAQVTGCDELIDLPWMIQCVQSATDLPLVLDSSNPKALQLVMEQTEFVGGPPILSSVTGEDGHCEKLLPLAMKYDCGLVALLMNDDGIQENPEGRFVICENIVERCRAAGLPDERLYIDPLALTIGTDTEAMNTLMKLLDLIKQAFPKVRTLCGASNVSFGMPDRSLLNRVTAVMMAAHGMEGFLTNVRDQKMMATLRVCQTMLGEDPMCMNMMRHYRAGRLERKPPEKKPEA
jgi:cobalamin-dependent methionine synthase I